MSSFNVLYRYNASSKKSCLKLFVQSDRNKNGLSDKRRDRLSSHPCTRAPSSRRYSQSHEDTIHDTLLDQKQLYTTALTRVPHAENHHQNITADGKPRFQATTPNIAFKAVRLSRNLCTRQV